MQQICKKYLAPVILMLLGSPIFSQDNKGSVKYNMDTTGWHGQGGYAVVDSIILKGNKITRERIIYRELLFRGSDSIPMGSLDSILERSRENLLNTSLFNFVTVTVDHPSRIARRPLPDTHPIQVTIDFIERWYVWPFPIFELSDRNFNAWLESRDFGRVSYGAFITWENFRGRMETLKLRLRFGYDEQYDLFYKVPYINKKETLGIGFGVGMSFNHETAYQTEDNKLLYFKDSDAYVKKETFSYIQLHRRKNMYNSHVLELKYHSRHFSDTLLALNPGYSGSQSTRLNYFTLYYLYKSDFRDFKSYPLTGYYFDAGFRKTGLGLMADNELDFLSVMATFRKYWQMQRRWFFAWGLNARFSSRGEQPFFLQRGLGYGRDFVRSYEYYVIQGQNYGIFKSSVKFALLPPRVSEIGFIPTEKFSKIHYALYVKLFADMGYADDPYADPASHNTLENALLIGYGVGVDLVTYYDVVIRAELSRNRMGETGVFIHFMAAI
ncbi:MAG: hypothetical protein R6T99_10680 [Bacteroidales bacterium]